MKNRQRRSDAERQQLIEQQNRIVLSFHTIFPLGHSSEASVDQLGLFNESEQLAEEAGEDPAPERETLAYTRHKPKRKPPPST